MEEGILISPRMMADHMPDYLTGVLRRMAAERSNPSQPRATDAPEVNMVREFQDAVRSQRTASSDKLHCSNEEQPEQATRSCNQRHPQALPPPAVHAKF